MEQHRVGVKGKYGFTGHRFDSRRASHYFDSRRAGHYFDSRPDFGVHWPAGGQLLSGKKRNRKHAKKHQGSRKGYAKKPHCPASAATAAKTGSYAGKTGQTSPVPNPADAKLNRRREDSASPFAQLSARVPGPATTAPAAGSSQKPEGLRFKTYPEKLRHSAPLFILLELLAVCAIGAYRLRSLGIIQQAYPELPETPAWSWFWFEALRTDGIAALTLLAVLLTLWLARPYLTRLASIAAGLLVMASGLFLTVTIDFLRVYQVGFSREYVGGEHFTGLGVMLKSARSELSGVSLYFGLGWLGLLALAIMVASFPWVRANKNTHAGRGIRLNRIKGLVNLGALSLLGLAVLSGGPVSRAWGLPPAHNDQDAESATMLIRELARNPLSALFYGPGRTTVLPANLATVNPTSDRGEDAPRPGEPGYAASAGSPEEGGRATPARYNSDSLELAGRDRPLPAAEKGGYNVILYFFESTSWQYFDYEFGGKLLLPTMHRLAQNGLLLKRHYSNFPLSANTMYSVYSSRHSMYGKSMIFADYHDIDVDTLPEVLKRRGYDTGLIHTGDLKYASRDKFLAHRGFDAMYLYADLMRSGEYPQKVGWGADERLMIRPALEWIKTREAPYFLNVIPVNPHHPYAIPEDFQRIVDPYEPGISEREEIQRNYFNSLHYADYAMGLFVDALEAEGLMDNTVFVMVTDHGEAFYQHRGNYNHPLFIYEENVHVPALFYSRQLFPGPQEYDSITRHVDIMPSILDLLGLADGSGRDGESIFSPSREKLAIIHTAWNDEFIGIADGPWKYIRRVKDAREELYNLDNDPFERDNLAERETLLLTRYRTVSDSAIRFMLDDYREPPRLGTKEQP